MEVLKIFQLTERTCLQLVKIDDCYEIHLINNGRILSIESDYDRACETFDEWKNYYS